MSQDSMGMTLKRIRLELARTPESPAGNPNCGYEFIAPLTQDNHIDADAWKTVKDHCGVLRFWGNQTPERGMLRHVGNGWRFDYDPRTDSDDERFFKLDRHSLVVGDYVSVTEHDGVQRPFRVVSVKPIVRTAWR
jgi:hypothetical protein